MKFLLRMASLVAYGFSGAALGFALAAHDPGVLVAVGVVIVLSVLPLLRS